MRTMTAVHTITIPNAGVLGRGGGELEHNGKEKECLKSWLLWHLAICTLAPLATHDDRIYIHSGISWNFLGENLLKSEPRPYEDLS